MEFRHHSRKEFLIVGLILLALTYFYRAGLFFSNFNLDEVILTLSSHNIKVQDYALFKPLTKSVGFFDVWQANRSFGSIDPGFFTLILHYWSLISTKTLWLRLLPFSFFLGSLFLLIKIATPTKEKLYYGFFSLFLIFRDQLIMDHAYTIRPYAMEMMGTFFLFSFLVHFKAEWRRDNILYVLILSFFLGSRYFFWINTACALLSFLWVEFRASNLNFRDLVKLFSLPMVIILFLLIFTFLDQAQTLDLRYMSVSYNTSRPWLLDVFKSLTFRLFLSYPVYLLFFKRSHLDNKEKKVLIFLVLSFCAYVLLSLLKISPFRIEERFSIGFHVLGIVSMTLFLKEVFQVLLTHQKKMALLVSLIVLSFCFNGHFIFNQQSEIISIVRELEKQSGPNERVYCDAVSCSMIRFLRDFTAYKLDWSNMPSFENIPDAQVEVTSLNDKKSILVIAPIGNLGKLGKRISEDPHWTIKKGYYYQRLYIKI